MLPSNVATFLLRFAYLIYRYYELAETKYEIITTQPVIFMI